MKNIVESFSGVEVLHGVDFFVEQGHVHALLGENGAGKSTLMNILGGVIRQDQGEIIFDGQPLQGHSIKEATERGIAFVHQELNVINDMKVWENIFLNQEITKFTYVSKREMIRLSRELFAKLGVDIDPEAEVASLETSQKQLLEIAKAFHSEAKLFILDEPTTALNNQEIEHLFTIIRNLQTQNKSFIFISHKLPEIFSIADSYTVFRNGYLVQAGLIRDVTAEILTKLMVGENYSEVEAYEARNLGDPVLVIEHLSGVGFRDINLSVRAGEVIGLTGLKGAGESEFLQSLFGANPITEGQVKIFDHQLAKTKIQTSMKLKVGMLPANRKENSVLPDMMIWENSAISEFTISPWPVHINRSKELKKYQDLKELLNIKSNSAKDPLVSLSGGNQQKVLLARWLNTKAQILLLDNPTQGIDVGAKLEIYKLIIELSKQGIAVIFSTLEIPELQKVADRCIVFYQGRINAELDRKQINEETVMLYATNVRSNNTLNSKEEIYEYAN
jgi:ribose transport system ATP-binding protein